jgi:hypothetical protein
MNEYLNIQIARTRFAVSSDYAAFFDWLKDRNRGFMAQEEPHFRINIAIKHVGKDNSKGRYLSMKTDARDYERGELTLIVESTSDSNLYWMLEQICMRCAAVYKSPRDLLMHSSAVVEGGKAFLFLGKSGAGKSTVCHVLSGDPSINILHDDMTAVSQEDDHFRVWNTPLSGEIPGDFSESAPLQAVFLLKQDPENYTVKMRPWKAAGQISLNLVPPLVPGNGTLVPEPSQSLDLLLKLAEQVPCYELHFRPERDFWKCVQETLNTESVIR